ncbi:MAG: type II toxin-antitoxin system Phd/YefM family antitoxin [Chitinivibrionia bacterium]|nr:type II toxin-antitoxin system Phd/YefM family antitoxin [Chitinivibrionia bacterium]
MLVETKQMLPMSLLQKKLPSTIKSVRYSGNAVYVIENNVMEAVLLSYKEYEYLKKIEEAFELMEINDMLQSRMENYDPSKNIPWEKVRENI